MFDFNGGWSGCDWRCRRSRAFRDRRRRRGRCRGRRRWRRNCEHRPRSRRRRHNQSWFWRLDRRRWRRGRCGFRFNRRGLRRSGRLGRRLGRGRSFNRSGLLADDRFQHVSGLGDMRKINLGLDSVRLGAGGCGLRECRFAMAAEMTAHLLRFIELKGTRVGLLFGNAHFRQDVKNLLALDFQLPGQIVDSNLTHPPSVASAVR